jgi:hypothetical protein
MNKFCPFLTSLYTITTENNKTNWIPCVNTECAHYDTKGNPACKLDIVSFSDLLIKAIDNSEDRLWALGKVHDIIGLVICKDQVVNKLTALRKAIDVTIYFLEDK